MNLAANDFFYGRMLLIIYQRIHLLAVVLVIGKLNRLLIGGLMEIGT